MIRRRPMMRLDAQRKELMDDNFYFFDLIVNDVTGQNRDAHGSYIPSHWHREMEVFLMVEGSAQISAGDKTYEACAGEGYFINSEVLHSFAFVKGEVEYRSFLFDPGIIAGAPGSVFDSVYVRPMLEGGPSLLKFCPGEDAPFFQDFQRVFQACEQEPPGYEFEARAALSRILLLAREKGQVLPARRVATAQETRVKEMLCWMEEHLGEPLTLGDIAGQANICTRACQKAFQRYLHCSPMEYLQRRRIFTAAERLALSDQPITAIALDCGFSSPSYFSKQFKSQMGITPLEYRAVAQRELSGFRQEGG